MPEKGMALLLWNKFHTLRVDVPSFLTHGYTYTKASASV
jgi:hypothetical protein